MIYQINLSFSLSLVLMGFLLANIFGILTNNKNIIFLFVLCLEIINYLVYCEPSNKKIKPSFFSTPIYFFYQPFKKLNIFKPLYFTKTPLKKNFHSSHSVNHNTEYGQWHKQQKRILLKSPLQAIAEGKATSLIIRSLNFLKIGFQFGSFVDAFKLGS